MTGLAAAIAVHGVRVQGSEPRARSPRSDTPAPPGQGNVPSSYLCAKRERLHRKVRALNPVRLKTRLGAALDSISYGIKGRPPLHPILDRVKPLRAQPVEPAMV